VALAERLRRAVGVEHMRASRQNKKQIWCALEWRKGEGNANSNSNDRGNGEIRLVQRPRKGLAHAGHVGTAAIVRGSTHDFTYGALAHVRHSITVTDYTVHVLRNAPVQTVWPRPSGASPRFHTKPPKSKWIAIDRIPQMPITGLTRKS